MLGEMFALMGEMFLLMLIGYIAGRIGIITKAGKLCLTNLILYVILPCNILKAFLNETGVRWGEMLEVLILASLIQVFCSLIALVCYRFMDPGEKAVYQYATVCSNAGFMGNPLSQAVFGDIGPLYTSIFLIPQRIVMWTAGVSYFQQDADKKSACKKVLLHPCMIAVYIGLVMMLCGAGLPAFLDRTVSALSSCTTAMTMLYIGTILVDIDFRTLITKKQLYFALLRLLLIPLAVLLVCRAAQVDSLITEVCTFLTAMPAGSTTSLLAVKYHADDKSAARCVVLTTLLSVVTIPVWGMVLKM